jgi:hypothetical protein
MEKTFKEIKYFYDLNFFGKIGHLKNFVFQVVKIELTVSKPILRWPFYMNFLNLH